MESVVVKSGYLTTEFWLAFAVQGVAIAVLFGFIPHADQQGVQASLSEAIQNAAALVASAVSVWKYIQSRTEVKTLS